MPIIPSQIIGHQRQCAELLSDIAHDNISHAYLFVGPKHIGKFTVARFAAWRILADGKTGEEVERIKDHIERLIHPDLLSLDMLWIKEKQEDWNKIGQYSNVSQQHRTKSDSPPKTDTIGIDDIRALQGRLNETGSSRHLCCLIHSIDRMQGAAANAFLKMLEEPPPRVVFLLTAESEHAVLPTIASRTRIVRFHPVPREQMRGLLGGRSDEEAAFALHLSEGAPGTLSTLLADPDLLRSKRQLHGQAKQFWQASSLLERLRWLLTYAEAKADIGELLLHLGLTLREHPDTKHRAGAMQAYMMLVRGLETNAHRGLLLEQFALAVTEREC